MTLPAPFDAPFVLLDVETTGADLARDRVIEVGAVFVRDGIVEREYASLVRPQQPVPRGIQAFTGISEDMLRDAPVFADIAAELHARLNGYLFVAHNARFDLGFMRREFARCGLAFDPPVLCTVKLSRALDPRQPRHGLDALIARHGLACDARHRALGDARVLHDLIVLAAQTHGPERLLAAAERAMRAPQLPAHLDPALLDEVPEGAGVLLLFGEGGQALQVIAADQLRAAMLSRLSAGSGGKPGRLARKVVRVDWEETVGMLGAQLRAHALEQELAPRTRSRARPVAGAAMMGLPAWPFAGAVAVPERDPVRGREALHVFGDWCHLGSVADSAELAELLGGGGRFVPGAAQWLWKALRAGRLEYVTLAPG